MEKLERKVESSFIGVVGEQTLALETHRHANSDISYNINAPSPNVSMPLLVYSASGGYHC